MNSGEIETKEGQVSEQITRQEQALKKLSVTIDKLEECLNTLCTLLLMDINIKDMGEPEQELVPLAHRIRESLRCIEEQDARLTDIIARLEI